MKKNTVFTLFVSLALLVSSVIPSLAYDAATLSRHDARILSDLSAEKRQAADAIVSEMNARIAPLQEKLLAKRLELDVLSRNPGMTPQAVSALAGEVASMDMELRQALADRAQRLTDATGFVWGQGRGYGVGYNQGRGYGMGHNQGRGYGMGYNQGCGYGIGHTQGRGYGMGYGRGADAWSGCIYR